MTIGKDLLSLSDEEWATFIAARRRMRLVTPKRKPKRATVKALAKAWSVPESVVEQAVKNVKEKS